MTTATRKIQTPFHPLTVEEIKHWYQDKLLTTAGYILAIRRVTKPPSCKFVIPNVLEFCSVWGISRSAFYRAIAELKEKGYSLLETARSIVLHDCEKVTSFPTKHSLTATPEKKAGFDDNFGESHERDSQSHERDSQSHERESQSHERDTQTPEPALCNGSEVSHTTQTIQTNQTGAGDEKNQQEEYLPTQNVQKPSEQVNHQEDTNGQLQRLNSVLEAAETKESSNSPSRVNIHSFHPRSDNDSQIPADLKAKLEELSIPLDARVRKAIASHDLSQAYGAVAHVEQTWETIDNPRGVFLFQIKRQPVEPLGARGAVRQASEFGWTLDFVKRMYPDNWQEAAQHFGVEVQVS